MVQQNYFQAALFDRICVFSARFSEYLREPVIEEIKKGPG